MSNEDSGDISVINAASGGVETTLSVGKRPRGVRLSKDGRLLYVALSGSPKAGPNVLAGTTPPPPDRRADGIGVVDLAQHRVVQVLESGADPESFDVAGEQLVVSNEDTAMASLVKLDSGRVAAQIPVGAEPEGVATRPDGRVAYVTAEASGEVFAIDVARGQVLASIAVDARPRGVAFSPDGAHAYVTSELGSSLAIVDARAHRLETKIAIAPSAPALPPARPMGVVVSPNGEHVFVTTGRGQAVVDIDPRSHIVLRVLDDVAPRPWGIGISSDGRRLYVAGGPSNDVAVVDVDAWRVERRIAVGHGPWGIAVGHATIHP